MYWNHKTPDPLNENIIMIFYRKGHLNVAKYVPYSY